MSLTCPRCDEWCPLDALVCVACGCRLTLDAVRAPGLPAPSKASRLDRGEYKAAYPVEAAAQE